MIAVVLRAGRTLARDAVEVVKNSGTSAFSEELASAVDEQVVKTSEINKSSNFHHLH